MTTHGIGVPIQDTDIEDWYADTILNQTTPFLTWNSAYSHMPTHWPMIWRTEQLQTQYQAGTPILLINEPEYTGQADLTYEQAAEVVRRFRNWPGPVYGCGTAWFSDGYEWMTGFIDYIGDDISILDGMHLHCYAVANIVEWYDDYGERFAQLAKDHDWPVVISEYGLTGGNDNDRDRFVKLLQNTFSPTYMFLFSWKYHLIPDLDVVNADGSFTDIGLWWTKVASMKDKLFLPHIST